MSEREFPELLNRLLLTWLLDDEPIESFSCERETWSGTSMGLGGIDGRMITPGWVVTITRLRSVEVWHVSAFGGVRLKSSSGEPGSYKAARAVAPPVEES